MCSMCGALGGHNQNRIVPVTDLPSETIEIRKDRWLRVVHYKPRLSRSDSGLDTQSNRSAHSASSAVSGISDPDYKRFIVIFFIHGVGGSADLWYEQLQYFCKAGYEVVAPDLLGHGQSSAPTNPADYEFSELSYDLMYLFDRYHKKRNVLVGHSYGSSFCAMIACERARLVSKMVLIAGGGPVPLVGVSSCDVFCLPTPLLSCIKPVFLSVYERRAYNSQKARTMKKKAKAFSAPPFVLKAVMAGQVWEEGDERYHQELMVPALLIYGAQDKFVTLEEEQWMEEVIYSSSLEVIQDAGHMVMVESPVKVNWLIHNFLQRDPTTRSLHRQSCDLSSKLSIHVATNNDVTNTQNEAGPLETVTECFNEEARRCSSGTLLEPLNESLSDVRRGSRSSLNVPGTITSTRRLSADQDDAEEVFIASPPRSSEIRVEIPQTNDTGKKTPSADNRVEASASDIHCLDSSADQDNWKSNENANASLTGSLSPSLGTVHIMRPLAGVAWTNNTNASTKSRHSLRSFLKPKIQGSENVTGSRSAPPSPANNRSAKF